MTEGRKYGRAFSREDTKKSVFPECEKESGRIGTKSVTSVFGKKETKSRPRKQKKIEKVSREKITQDENSIRKAVISKKKMV